MSDAALPIGSAEFDNRMRQLGPYEQQPLVAVALSGGVDSLTLLALVIEWAKPRSGEVLALIVDHGLRDESRDEAEQVRVLAINLGARAEILTWHHEPLRARIQELARQSRYRLLDLACQRHGVLHLAVGHQGDDQRETVTMRQQRGSHIRGLAGMSAILELDNCRIFRPLLPWPRSRIRATAKFRNLQWIEDPSNVSSRYWRGSFRKSVATTAQPITDPDHRRTTDARFNSHVANSILVHPLGVIGWPVAVENDVAPKQFAEFLGALAAAISGLDYPPAIQVSERLEDVRTFGGTMLCRKGDWRFLMREPSKITEFCNALPGQRVVWDKRFVLDNRQGKMTIRLEPRTRDLAKSIKPQSVARPASVAMGLPLVSRSDDPLSGDLLSPLMAGEKRPLLYFGTLKSMSRDLFAG